MFFADCDGIVTVMKCVCQAGGGLIRATVQSFVGLIVMALGVQFGLKGLSAFIQAAGG